MITEEARLVEYASIPVALDRSRSHVQAGLTEDGLADESPIEAP